MKTFRKWFCKYGTFPLDEPVSIFYVYAANELEARALANQFVSEYDKNLDLSQLKIREVK